MGLGEMVRRCEAGADRVDDDEADAVLPDDVAHNVDIVREVEGASAAIATNRTVENEDALGIRAVEIESRAEAGGGVVLGGDQEDIGAAGGCAIREGATGGEGTDEGGDDGGLAVAADAREDGEHAGGDPSIPEPDDVAGGDVREAGDGCAGGRKSGEDLLAEGGLLLMPGEGDDVTGGEVVRLSRFGHWGSVGSMVGRDGRMPLLKRTHRARDIASHGEKGSGASGQSRWEACATFASMWLRPATETVRHEVRPCTWRVVTWPKQNDIVCVVLCTARHGVGPYRRRMVAGPQISEHRSMIGQRGG